MNDEATDPQEPQDDLGPKRRGPRPTRRRQRLPPDPEPGAQSVIAALLSERIVASGKDPRRLAELYLDEKRLQDEPMIARWANAWWQYDVDQGAYRELSAEEFRADLWRVLDRVELETRTDKGVEYIKLPLKSSLVTNVADALTSVAPLIVGDSPQWVRPDYQDPPIQFLVPCANGALDVRERKLRRRTPRLFATSSVGAAWRSTPQDCAEWRKFLASIWPDDAESIDTLREMFGYFLTSDTSLQKVFAIIGPARSGKGTIARVLNALLGGPRAVTNPMISTLASDHGLAPLVGKTLAILGDARIGKHTDQAKVVEVVLAISGEDSVTINQKNKPMFDTRLRTRLLFLSNEVPSLYEASGALVSRFIMLRTSRQFLGEEDLGLEGKLLAELPGIFQWAVDGWETLHERGRFRQPASAADLIDDMQSTGSPVALFAKERCVVAIYASVRVQALYDEFVSWCKESGREAGTKQKFGIALKAAFPKIRKSQPRDDDGKSRIETYNGIGILDIVDRTTNRENT